MNHSSSTALRHTPKQTRGQRKVEQILRSAEALFAEIGFESATTNSIADRAGISIGSLYQFFASKDAILEMMAGRYLEQTQNLLTKTLESDERFKLDDLLGYLLEALVRLQEQRPYFLQSLRQSSPSPVVTRAVNQLTNSLAAQVRRLLARASVDQDPKLLKLRAVICVETISALLPVALHAKGRDRTAAIAEIKLVLMRYLEPTLKLKGTI